MRSCSRFVISRTLSLTVPDSSCARQFVLVASNPAVYKAWTCCLWGLQEEVGPGDDDDELADPAELQAMKRHFKQVRVRP